MNARCGAQLERRSLCSITLTSRLATGRGDARSRGGAPHRPRATRLPPGRASPAAVPAGLRRARLRSRREPAASRRPKDSLGARPSRAFDRLCPARRTRRWCVCPRHRPGDGAPPRGRRVRSVVRPGRSSGQQHRRGSGQVVPHAERPAARALHRRRRCACTRRPHPRHHSGPPCPPWPGGEPGPARIMRWEERRMQLQLTIVFCATVSSRPGAAMQGGHSAQSQTHGDHRGHSADAPPVSVSFPRRLLLQDHHDLSDAQRCWIEACGSCTGSTTRRNGRSGSGLVSIRDAPCVRGIAMTEGSNYNHPTDAERETRRR